MKAIADKWATPTYTLDLAQLLKPLFMEQKDVSGILHLANTGECTWQQYAQSALDFCHAEGIPMKARRVGASSLAEMKSFTERGGVVNLVQQATKGGLATVGFEINQPAAQKAKLREGVTEPTI